MTYLQLHLAPSFNASLLRMFLFRQWQQPTVETKKKTLQLLPLSLGRMEAHRIDANLIIDLFHKYDSDGNGKLDKKEWYELASLLIGEDSPLAGD